MDNLLVIIPEKRALSNSHSFETIVSLLGSLVEVFLEPGVRRTVWQYRTEPLCLSILIGQYWFAQPGRCNRPTTSAEHVNASGWVSEGYTGIR